MVGLGSTILCSITSKPKDLCLVPRVSLKTLSSANVFTICKKKEKKDKCHTVLKYVNMSGLLTKGMTVECCVGPQRKSLMIA